MARRVSKWGRTHTPGYTLDWDWQAAGNPASTPSDGPPSLPLPAREASAVVPEMPRERLQELARCAYARHNGPNLRPDLDRVMDRMTVTDLQWIAIHYGGPDYLKDNL